MRRPDGTPSDTVRTSSATIKILDRKVNYQMPVTCCAITTMPGRNLRSRLLAPEDLAVIPAGLKKWLAAGSGVGIQITGPRGAESMHIAAARVRPGGAPASKILRGGFTIENFPQQPAGRMGDHYAAFLRKLGMRHVTATVVLPRQDVIVRPLVLARRFR